MSIGTVYTFFMVAEHNYFLMTAHPKRPNRKIGREIFCVHGKHFFPERYGSYVHVNSALFSWVKRCSSCNYLFFCSCSYPFFLLWLESVSNVYYVNEPAGKTEAMQRDQKLASMINMLANVFLSITFRNIWGVKQYSIEGRVRVNH